MFGNPYMYGQMINKTGMASGGLLGGLKSINWSGFLSNTQKTLGIINQAIPIVYQVKPIVNNAKTMFRIANSITKPESNNRTSNNSNSNIESKENITYNKPIFYI